MNYYKVTIDGPDGKKKVLLSKEQVEFFKRDMDDDPYLSAAWLAYCDLWMQP